jgi:ribose 5-phosphate isomerase B
MRIGIAADHAGFVLREPIALQLHALGHETMDFGSTVPVVTDDYLDAVTTLARSVAQGEVERGIAISQSGVGACIVANKVRGVRAGACHDTYSARRGVEENDMNVLVLGAHVVGAGPLAEIIVEFAMSRFNGDDTCSRRLDKIKQLELHEGSSVETQKGAAL